MQVVKRLGILGGLSWASSLKYYEAINLEVLRLTNGQRAADLVLWSFDFTQFEPLIAAGDWRTIGRLLHDATRKLIACDVKGVIIACNTIHRAVEQELLKLPVPFLHIRDCLVEELNRLDINRVGFIGTSATMKGDVYRNLVDSPAGIEVVLPPEELWADIDDMIFGALCRGLRRPGDYELMRGIMRAMASQDVRCVVLGCTELGLLEIEMPGMTLLDTTEVHARDAARWCVEATPMERQAKA
jgi:aspartate racemase